jgi:hypothetical protein
MDGATVLHLAAAGDPRVTRGRGGRDGAPAALGAGRAPAPAGHVRRRAHPRQGPRPIHELEEIIRRYHGGAGARLWCALPWLATRRPVAASYQVDGRRRRRRRTTTGRLGAVAGERGWRIWLKTEIEMVEGRNLGPFCKTNWAAVTVLILTNGVQNLPRHRIQHYTGNE